MIMMERRHPAGAAKRSVKIEVRIDHTAGIESRLGFAAAARAIDPADLANRAGHPADVADAPRVRDAEEQYNAALHGCGSH
jgi:hypothetical protein